MFVRCVHACRLFTDEGNLRSRLYSKTCLSLATAGVLIPKHTFETDKNEKIAT